MANGTADPDRINSQKDHMDFFFLIFCVASFLFPFPGEQGEGPLDVFVICPGATSGVIRVGVYTENSDFPKVKAAAFSKIMDTSTGLDSFLVHFDKVPYGSYAIAAFHDANSNGKLDKNFMGIPVEPYGFSNNPLARWNSPPFQESQFDFTEHCQPLMIRLLAWNNH